MKVNLKELKQLRNFTSKVEEIFEKNSGRFIGDCGFENMDLSDLKREDLKEIVEEMQHIFNLFKNITFEPY